jgi:hypothetical protein
MMRARVVDWSLLALVLLGIASGLWSFLVGDPQGRLLFIAHGALGIAILGVLALKVRRVTPLVLSSKARRSSMVVGVLTAISALVTVLLGIWWVVIQSPVDYPNGMILHTTAAFILLGFCLWHLFLRYRPLTTRDLQDRRSLLRLMAILVGGGALWAGLETTQRVLATPGSRRRFTGSRLAGDGADSPFPVTMWMFDRPSTIDIERYVLDIGGAVITPLRFTMNELAQLPQTSLHATLDCTGGWYSEQEWGGVAVGELLAQAQLQDSARFVRFRSITGYRWSLPLAEATQTLLATHVGGTPLDHGHGAPLRLVAPGRRGFQWVKWVVAVEALPAPDVGQWAAIFMSGLDGA